MRFCTTCSTCRRCHLLWWPMCWTRGRVRLCASCGRFEALMRRRRGAGAGHVLGTRRQVQPLGHADAQRRLAGGAARGSCVAACFSLAYTHRSCRWNAACARWRRCVNAWASWASPSRASVRCALAAMGAWCMLTTVHRRTGRRWQSRGARLKAPRPAGCCAERWRRGAACAADAARSSSRAGGRAGRAGGQGGA